MWWQRLNLAARHRKSHASHHRGMFIYKNDSKQGPSALFLLLSNNFLCGQLIFQSKTLSGIWSWWPLTLLWVYRGDSRGKKINMCIDTNDNVHRNWTLTQYFNNATDNICLEYMLLIVCLAWIYSLNVLIWDVCLVGNRPVKMPASQQVDKPLLPATESGKLPCIYWLSLGVFLTLTIKCAPAKHANLNCG